MKKIALGILSLAACAALWLAHALHSRPSVERWAANPVPRAADGSDLTVTFLGVSTLLVRDGTTALMIDGFFSRPGLVDTAFLPLAPDAGRIAAALAKAGVERLDAVVAVHSHYDHAMDSPEVARRTGAIVVGSTSTANIARGQGLPEDRLRVVRGGESLRFGEFVVTMLPSRHFPHGQAMGEIDQPLVPPARVAEWREGGSFAVLIERGPKTLLVNGSAGWQDGALAGRRADVVYLGVGLLGSKDEAYRDGYWNDVVAATGARRVVPIHWDDFTRGLDEPLVALPFLLDDLDASMEFVTARSTRDGVDLRWPVLWEAADPFAGL